MTLEQAVQLAWGLYWAFCTGIVAGFAWLLFVIERKPKGRV